MRRRDIRAIGFCLVTTLAVAISTWAALGSWILAGLLATAWLVFILTRPRMIRVMRRLRGDDIEAFSYYED